MNGPLIVGDYPKLGDFLVAERHYPSDLVERAAARVEVDRAASPEMFVLLSTFGLRRIGYYIGSCAPGNSSCAMCEDIALGLANQADKLNRPTEISAPSLYQWVAPLQGALQAPPLCWCHLDESVPIHQVGATKYTLQAGDTRVITLTPDGLNDCRLSTFIGRGPISPWRADRCVYVPQRAVICAIHRTYSPFEIASFHLSRLKWRWDDDTGRPDLTAPVPPPTAFGRTPLLDIQDDLCVIFQDSALTHGSRHAMESICSRAVTALKTYPEEDVSYLWEGLCDLNLCIVPTYPPLARMIQDVASADNLSLSHAFAAKRGSSLPGLARAVEQGRTVEEDTWTAVAESVTQGSHVYFHGNSLGALTQLSSMAWQDEGRKLQLTVVMSRDPERSLAGEAARLGLKAIKYEDFEQEADGVDYLVIGVYACYRDGIFAHPGTIQLLRLLRDRRQGARIIAPTPVDKRWPDCGAHIAPKVDWLEFIPLSEGLIDRFE